VVAERPGLAERTAFQRDRAGHWRSGYPILPGLVAAVPATLLQTIGLVDMSAPLAPNLVAVLTASCLTAGAVVFVFLSLTRIVEARHAMLTALGLGLGTNYWAGVSQTLGQHELVAFGMSLALWGWWRATAPSLAHLAVGALGLAIAGAARPQIAPMIVVLGAALVSHIGWRRAAWPLGLIAGVSLLEVARNLWWFGHPLGAAMNIESVHLAVHNVSGALAGHPWTNAAALLVSPSRGLLIFSPVVLVALAGLRRNRFTPDLRWLAGAAAVQFVAYSCYSVWWGGHTFGPRYTLDLLIMLTPFAALGVAFVAARPWAATAAGVLLAWSVTVSAVGAFVYPNDKWNSEPLDVDLRHERLWEWHDSQLSRAWQTPRSPQNFRLFQRAAVRQEAP
jgi:hypothetical protein